MQNENKMPFDKTNTVANKQRCPWAHIVITDKKEYQEYYLIAEVHTTQETKQETSSLEV